MSRYELPGNCHLTYCVMHDAYWSASAWTGLGNNPQINVEATSGGGGARWEFAVEQVTEQHGTLRLKMFAESWSAFTEIPEFFRLLAGVGNGATLTDVQTLLDRIGAIDETPRVEVTR